MSQAGVSSGFGELTTINADNHRYLVFKSSGDSSSISGALGVSTAKKNITSSGIIPFTPQLTKVATDADFTAKDETGADRTSVHGIPIMATPADKVTSTLKAFSMMYAFPAILAPAITNKVSITLPEPTEGGTINLFIQDDELQGLLDQYKQLYTLINTARSKHPYTHYFGIPLGPVNSFTYDFKAKPSTSAIDSKTHLPTVTGEANAINTQDYILPTKFMQSDTAPILAKHVMSFYAKCGVDTTHCLDSIPVKHDSYSQSSQVGPSTGESLKLLQQQNSSEQKPAVVDHPKDHPADDYAYWIKHSIMPIPKLHATLFLTKILSLDEYNAVQNLLTMTGIQRLIYDAIGGTSLSLRIRDTEVWNPTQVNGKTMAKHFVAVLGEVGKEGKLSAKDNVPASEDDNCQKKQYCPRLARIVGLLSHALLKTGCITPNDIVREKLGNEAGQFCQVGWHMTLLNARYSQRKGNPNFLLDVDHFLQHIKGVPDWGQHRVPCINLYRMGSQVYVGNSKQELFDQYVDPKWATFDWLPYRHQIQDHYVIDASINMP